MSWVPNNYLMWNTLLPMPPKSQHNNSFLGSVYCRVFFKMEHLVFHDQSSGFVVVISSFFWANVTFLFLSQYCSFTYLFWSQLEIISMTDANLSHFCWGPNIIFDITKINIAMSKKWFKKFWYSLLVAPFPQYIH